MSDFQTFINEERSRLTKKRDELTAQIADLQGVITGLDRELNAIGVYEKARTGKEPTVTTARGSRREKVLAILKDNPKIEPKDIIAKLGGTFHKGGIHTLLSTLKKAGTITAQDGKYSLA